MRGYNLSLSVQEYGELTDFAASTVVARMIMVMMTIMMPAVGGSMMRITFDTMNRLGDIRQYEDARKHPPNKSLIYLTILHLPSINLMQR
jgi:hypothetical protein